MKFYNLILIIALMFGCKNYQKMETVASVDLQKYAGKCSNICKMPENMEPIALIPIGYPAIITKPIKQRNPLDQIVHWNKF